MAWRFAHKRSVARLGLAGAVALIASAVPAAAASPGEDFATPRDGAPASLRQVTGANVRLTSSGLYRVDVDRGPDVFTHGPDPMPPDPELRAAGEASIGSAFKPGSPERAPICAEENSLQVLYAHPAGSPDLLAEYRPQLQAVVRRMDSVLNAESLASGGPNADYRVHCDPAGEIAVAGIETGGFQFADVVAAARAAGYGTGPTHYLVFYDGPTGGACGIASYRRDENLSTDNVANLGGGYGIVYSGCWFNETPMHESAHLMGAVQYGAPHSTGTGGHCAEGVDVMCYSPDGGNLNQSGLTTNCDGAVRFDCGFDDYFDSAPEPGEYLESHWNLGSPLNLYLAFSADGTPIEPVSTPKERSDRRTERLGSGGKKRGATGTPRSWQQFELRVPRRASMVRARIFAAPGADLAVFVRGTRKPTRNVFKCRQTLHNRHATCRIEDPEPGRWYVGVMTRGGAPGLAYRLRADTKRAHDRRR